MAKDKGKEDAGKKNEEKGESKEKKVPEIPYPDDMDVDSIGENGEYTFIIQVLSKKKGVWARVLIEQGDKKKEVKPTDESGFLEYKAEKFTEEEREFFFRVHGYDVHYEITLPGPETEKKEQPKIEKPKTIPGGFMANFRNVKDCYDRRKENE